MRRGVWTAGPAIAGLVLSSIVPAGALAAPASDARAARTPIAVSALDAPASTSREGGGGSIPEGDFAPLTASDGSRPTLASVSEPVALDERLLSSAKVVDRDERTTYLELSNGLRAAVVADQPVNVRTEAGWSPISNRLTPSRGQEAGGASGGWTGVAHPLAPVFAAAAGDGPILTVARDRWSLAWSLIGAARSEGAVTEVAALHREPSALDAVLPPPGPADEVDYPDVLPGVDLRYRLRGAQVKEELVLRERPDPAADAPEFRFLVESSGLTPTTTDLGEVVFLDDSGAGVFVVPVPVMWDSSGVPERREPASANASVSVERTEQGWVVSLTPDPGWLLDEERVYPVVLDPSQLWVSPFQEISWKSDGTVYTDSQHIGNTGQTPSRIWRGFADVSLQAFAGMAVYDTVMQIAYSGYGTTTCRSGNVGAVDHWPPVSVGDYYADLSSFSGLCTGDAYASNAMIDVLDAAVAQTVRVGSTHLWLGVRGEEIDAYTYKEVTTALLVVYYAYPTIASVAGPSAGAVGPRAPTFTTTVSADPVVTPEVRYELEEVVGAGDGLGAFTQIAFTSPWVPDGAYTVPSGVLQPDTHYRYRVTVRDRNQRFGDAHESVESAAGFHFVTNTPPVIDAVDDPAVSPAVSGSGTPTMVTSLTPTFTAPYATGGGTGTVLYRFQVVTGSDALTGLIADSGWITPPGTPAPGDPVTWTPEPGALRDGIPYTWTVLTDDGVDTAWRQDWIGRFTVNRRLGVGGPAPVDTVGPVTVNLANGNAALAFASPTVSTLGGPMGMVFSYNSLADPDANRGLVGTYYDALNPNQSSTTSFDFTGRTPVLTRTDASIHFDWGEAAPAPAVPADFFLARWQGYATLSGVAAGSYELGIETGAGSGGARIVVDGTTVLDAWSGLAPGIVWATTATGLGTTPKPFKVEAYAGAGAADVTLRARPAGGGGDGFIVPADWFTRTLTVLPGGWSSSAPLSGAASPFLRAEVTEAGVSLTDVGGGTTAFTRVSDGGYRAPDGVPTLVALDAAGLVSATTVDGTVTTFDAAGQVASVTTPGDALKPATPTPTYRANGLVSRLTDPVDGRRVVFAYGGDMNQAAGLTDPADGGSSADACPAPPGYAAAPVGMLCRIVYPGHVPGASGSADDTTRLYYDAGGQLAAIQDPGEALATFEYADGLLSRIRGALDNDWLAANAIGYGDPEWAVVGTELGYDAEGRVATVTLSAADGQAATARPMKTYTYQAGETLVDVAGLDATGSALGHAGRVAYDERWRTTSATTPTGLTATTVWDAAKDLVLATEDAQGLRTTTRYDAFGDLPTDVYGPAPSACFPGGLGAPDEQAPGCAVDAVAHSSTGYDADLVGLHAAYWPNVARSGEPKAFSLGLAGSGGTPMGKNWGSGAPPGIAGDQFSIRLTGSIVLPDDGYQLVVNSDDGVRVWVDDRLVLDSWSVGLDSRVSAPIPSAPDERHRIRIDYVEAGGLAQLSLLWRDGPSGTAAGIPVAATAPDYRLPTSAVADDATAVSGAAAPSTAITTGYGERPWLGQVVTSTLDPAGLALTTTTTYESPDAAGSWLRRLTRTLPSGAGPGAAGDPGAVTSAYYAYPQRQSRLDHTGDGHADVLGVDATGQAWLLPGSMDGVPDAPVSVGSGWQGSTAIFDFGDFDGDTLNDYGQRVAAGGLVLHRGSGTSSVIGSGWDGFSAIFSPGDWDGDGHVDLIVRDWNNDLRLYGGDGTGSWQAGYGQVFGWNWAGLLIGPAGDFDGDGHPDIFAKSGGTLWLYRGDGAGGWASPTSVLLSTSWSAYTRVIGGGDFDGDGWPDLIGVTAAGQATLFPGTGSGLGAPTAWTGGLGGFALLGDAVGAISGSGAAAAACRRPPLSTASCERRRVRRRRPVRR